MSLYMDMLANSRPIQEPAVEPYLPPGYRFHPTDEELVVYYLANKVADCRFTVAAIGEVDLNKCEPWDLPERAKMGENEWYFFSLKDRKYPTGLRTNRATVAGYWKATGKDREVMSGRPGYLVGMKKTLVFYRGRAPKGEKSNWIMHEYRLEGEPSSLLHLSKATKDEWVVCRIFKKNIGGKKTPLEGNNEPQASLPALLESPHTAVGAEDSGVTDSEQRDPLSYYHSQTSSCLKTSDEVNLWPSRAKEINNNLTGLRYSELPYDPKCNDTAYLNCFRGSQPSQDLRGLPSIMEPSAIMSSSYPADAPASSYVLRTLLQQYSNSGRSCKEEPTALDEAVLPKMAFKHSTTTTAAAAAAAGGWPSNNHIITPNLRMEASTLINPSCAINSTQQNSMLMNNLISANQVPSSIASMCMELNHGGVVNQLNDYSYSRHVTRPGFTGDQIPHNDMGSLWTAY